MNSDNLALSGFEEALRTDLNGAVLKQKVAYFEGQLQHVNHAMNHGVDGASFQRMQRLKETLETAKTTLSQVWHGIHAT